MEYGFVRPWFRELEGKGRKRMRVAVLGGGIQGAGVALEFAMKGVSVDLYERRDVLLSQASLQNEGKIHLGFVYANDPTMTTARLMAKGALSFEPTVMRWLESDRSDWNVSSPFHYFVHPESLLGGDELSAFYRRMTLLTVIQRDQW